MSSRPIVTGILALAFALAFSQPLSAQEPSETGAEEADLLEPGFRKPLASRNQMPLALLFVALTPEGARTIAPGDSEIELRFDYSNIISTQESEVEAVRLDLEYLRTQLAYRRGFGGGIELGVSVPFYIYYGGFLDPFIDSFHETFGFPNFLRGETPHGLTRFEYLRGGDVIFQGDDAAQSVGDVSLHAKKAIVQRGGFALAARTVLKLPTGRLERLSGSGAADGGFGLALERVGRRFGAFANVSYHVLGQPDGIPVKNFLSFLLGGDWRLRRRLAALLQFEHARPSIDGGLPMLRKGSQQVALGLRWRYSDRFVYEWRFVEDLSSFSPDFTFAFQMGIRFAGSP